MNINSIAKEINMKLVTPTLGELGTREVSGGYVSDMLSDVLANAPTEGLWVTTQVHLNVVAVAMHANVAGVIFASGREPSEAVIARAVQEEIPLFVSNETAFDIVGRLYHLGLRGRSA